LRKRPGRIVPSKRRGSTNLRRRDFGATERTEPYLIFFLIATDNVRY
jgi:hypothetical protein